MPSSSLGFPRGVEVEREGISSALVAEGDSEFGSVVADQDMVEDALGNLSDGDERSPPPPLNCSNSLSAFSSSDEVEWEEVVDFSGSVGDEGAFDDAVGDADMCPST